MYANANMSSIKGSKSYPGKKSRKSIKKKPGKPGNTRANAAPTPRQRGYDRYRGLENIKSRLEEDRATNLYIYIYI